MSIKNSQTPDGYIAADKGARFLKAWRQPLALSREDASGFLDLSLEAYDAYEAGEKDLPVKILLACHAFSKGRILKPSLPRGRWVTVVENIHKYAAGENVVGRMVRERDWQGLRDLMDVLKENDAELAVTDPHLFQIIRKAGTRAYLSGLMMLPGPSIELIEGLEQDPSGMVP